MKQKQSNEMKTLGEENKRKLEQYFRRTLSPQLATLAPPPPC